MSMETKQTMFNVGDKVAVYYNRYDNPVIDEIVRITPTGRIKLKKASVQYDKNGWEMGCRDSFHRSHIVPLTPELKQDIVEQTTISRAVSLCHWVKEKDLDYETAKKLIELLDKKGGIEND